MPLHHIQSCLHYYLPAPPIFSLTLTSQPLLPGLAPALLASRSCPALLPHYLLASPVRPCSCPALLPHCLFVARAQHCSRFLPAAHAAPCSYVCSLLLHLPGYAPAASLLFILCPTDLSRSCSCHGYLRCLCCCSS